MPIRAMLNTAGALGYWRYSQEVTANNLANLGSDAFKADRLAAHARGAGAYPEAVAHTDLRQGVMRETGRPLDLALEGAGWLVVATEDGERLSRGGSLHLDVGGRLTDASGAPLLGADGPVVVAGRELEVHGDGTVVVDGAIAGRLRLVQAPVDGLRKEGAGHFASAGPLAAAAEGAVRVRQGVVEESNADPLLGMVELVAIQRAYAANLDALRAMDGVLGTVVNQVGRVD